MADTESVPVTVPAPEAPNILSHAVSAPSAASTPDGDTLLSKNARKRQLKAERYAASKAERRARDKEKRQEKKRKRQVASVDEEQPRDKRRKVEDPKSPFHARIVIDLAFDDKMTEKEVVSLCSQLAYTYSSNRKARAPFDALLCTSLNGKTLARLEALGGHHKRWHGVEFWEKGYEDLWGASQDGGDADAPMCAKESVVYLTGDAEDELEELHEGETYIIGGICDRNRYKNLCLNKAKEHSIRSARLPIGKYLANLPTRKILTVNQVFDILLRWTEEHDWSKALYAVMPKRKFQQGSQSGGGSSVRSANNPLEETDVAGDGDLEEANVDTEVGASVGDTGAAAEEGVGADTNENAPLSVRE